MKKSFLFISSILFTINAVACWLGPSYTQEYHKHFLIPNLFTTSEYRHNLIATKNIWYSRVNYDIYTAEEDDLIIRLTKLGISKDVITLMCSKIVSSVSITNNYTEIIFKEHYKHKQKRIYELSISKFYSYDIIQEFQDINQLELLRYLMYRHVVLFNSQNTEDAKKRLQKYIVDKIENCTSDLVGEYAMLLIDLNLHNRNPAEVVSNYMKYFHDSKRFNLIAYSHFCGAVSDKYALYPTDKYFEYRNNRELSVYLFSKLFKYPKLFKNTEFEISYVIDLNSNFDWEKCLSYCKTQEEIDQINLVKVSIFDGVNISLLDYFKEKTTKNSKLFETALTQYVQKIEYNLFSPLYISGEFKEDYTKNSEFVNKFALADAIDLEKYLKSINIENKVLLHLLRGYTSFMLGDYINARREYSRSETALKNATYLEKKQHKGYVIQLEGLKVLGQFNKEYTKDAHKNLNNRLTTLLRKTYLSGEMESYFELGMTQAVGKHDFVSAILFTSKKGFHYQNILDVFMTNDDLMKLLTLIEKDQLPFNERHPKSIRFAVIEQIGTNYFRDHNLLNAKKYFDLLPDHIFSETGKGGNAYYQIRPYSWNYYNFPVDFSRTDKKLIKRYNKKTALETIISMKADIKLKHKKINLAKYDSLILNKLRKDISNLNFDLSCIYSSPFWGYSRIWHSGLNRGIYYSDSPPFNVLDSEYVRTRIDSFLHKYGNQNKSIEYLNKSIEYTDDMESLAQFNFKLYNKLNNPFSTSFHKRKYYTEDWHSDWDIWDISYQQSIEIEKREHEIIVTGLLIDSLYKNTNYFKEVISECSDFKKSNLLGSTNEGDNQTIINNTDVVTEHKDELRDIYKILSLILLIIIITLFIYIKIKK